MRYPTVRYTIKYNVIYTMLALHVYKSVNLYMDLPLVIKSILDLFISFVLINVPTESIMSVSRCLALYSTYIKQYFMAISPAFMITI